MVVTTHNFPKVEIKAERRLECDDCGNPFTRSKRFWQTINPFNRDADGHQKSRSDIEKELAAKADAWHPETQCGCIERMRDERPEVRKPAIPQTEKSVGSDIEELLAEATQLYENLGAIREELANRLVGLKIEEKDRAGTTRTGYITDDIILNRNHHNGKAYVGFLTWQGHKKNPWLQLDRDSNRYYRGLSNVKILPPEDD